MPPPAKRRRLFDSSDPDAELSERRARNHKKLKSRFESIFEKYSRDFTGIGDIIDFEKGEIVVNNGHIRNMEDETDAGYEHVLQLENHGPTSNNIPDENQPERVAQDPRDDESDDDDPLGMIEDVISTNIRRMRKGVELSLSQSKNGFCRVGHADVHKAVSTPQDDRWVEPAWRVPLLPTGFNARHALPSPSPSVNDDSDSSRSASPPGVSIWALPQRTPQAKAHTSLDNNATDSAVSKPSASPWTPWTRSEIELLQDLKTSGEKWTEIRKQLPNRTSAAIQMYWSTSRKKAKQTVIRNGDVSSGESVLHSSENTGNENDILMLISNRLLQAEVSDTLSASKLSRNPDAELEVDLASLLVPESESDSCIRDSQKIISLSEVVIPDSQDSTEPQQLPEQSPDLQTEALNSHPRFDNRQDNTAPSQASPIGTVVNPVLVGSSFDTSPDASNMEHTFSRQHNHTQAPLDQLRKDLSGADAPSLVLTESRPLQCCDSRQRVERVMDPPSEQNPVYKTNRSMEHRIIGVEGSPCSADTLSSPLALLDFSSGPIEKHLLKEHPDSDALSAVSPWLIQASTFGSSNEQTDHEIRGETDLSEVSPSIFEAQDPPSNLSIETKDVAANDVRKRRRQAAAAATSQMFMRVEIPLPPYTTPVTPPRALLPAQEESLRKIKPFSLVLPIEGSPTRYSPLQWKSPYLQSLDQKYRLSQGALSSDAVSPKIGFQLATVCDESTQSAACAPAVGAEDLGFASYGSSTEGSFETDAPTKCTAVPSPIPIDEEDVDDLQLLIKPTIADSLHSKRRQTHSGRTKNQLAFRTKIGSDDISDDELSTPSKTLHNRAEMTPVQASTVRIRRLSSASLTAE
ncbi:MAG: hypothetical protein Q9213_006984 [Squamulea squamosa]